MEQQTKIKDNQFSPYQFSNLTQRHPPANLEIDKEFSPWNSEDYRKFIQPRYYQSINPNINLHKKKFKRPTNISHSSDNKNTFGLKISHDFLNLVKLQKKGAFLHNETIDSKDKPMKMKLVNVNLDYDVIYCPQKKYGLPMENIDMQKRLTRQDHYRQQPTKVRLSKQIRQKHTIAIDKKKQCEDLNSLFKFSQTVQMHPQQISFYPSMPKRLPKVKDYSYKLPNVPQSSQRSDMLPSLSLQKQRSIGQQTRQQTILYGKGSILQKNDKQKLRKLKYRSYLTKDHFNPHKKDQKILFLCQADQK